MQLLRNLAALLATNFIWGEGALTGEACPLATPQNRATRMTRSCCSAAAVLQVGHSSAVPTVSIPACSATFSSARGTTRAARLDRAAAN